MTSNKFEGRILDLWLENGIVCGKYKVEHINLEAAKLATEERLAFFNDHSYPAFVDYSEVKSTNKEARDFFASPAATTHFLAMGILISSPLGRIMGNFFIQISKPKVPTKIFTDREKAFEWLQQFTNINIS